MGGQNHRDTYTGVSPSILRQLQGTPADEHWVEDGDVLCTLIGGTCLRQGDMPHKKNNGVFVQNLQRHMSALLCLLPSQRSRASMAGSLIINGKIIAAMIRHTAREIEEWVAAIWKKCPNCKFRIYNGDVSSQWPGLPAGVKFEPTDQELLMHLEGKVGRAASHVLIDDFIPTIEEVDGICYTHPKNLPGIKMDGRSSYFFHTISNAYDVGQRKRRKISNNNHTDCDEQIRWHMTGTPSAIKHNGVTKGWKKILVLKCGKGKIYKANWTIHQCHLGVEKDEKHGDLVVSRVFWQLKSNTGKSQMHAVDAKSGQSDVNIDPTTPNMYAPQPRRLSGSPFETEQNQKSMSYRDGSSAVQLQANEDLAGSSESVDYSVLSDLDEHPLPNDDIPDARHEKPLPPDYPGMDALCSDQDCTFLRTPLDFPL
ncbi:hypothetical protein ACQ4PT_024832 [Festuca glaucescens]